MNKHAVLALIAAPGLLALAWFMWQAFIGQSLEVSAAARSWPTLSHALGLEPFTPAEAPRGRWVAGAMRGTFEGREVVLQTGQLRMGSGSGSTVERFTRWETTSATPGLTVTHLKALDKLLPTEGVQTGDAAFDREYHVAGDEETVRTLLTPAAREALSAYRTALGELRLEEGILRHTSYQIVTDPHELQAILDWQAWLLSALGAQTVPARPADPPRTAPEGGHLRSTAVVLLVVLLSTGGATAYRNHLNAEAGQTLERFEPKVGDRVVANYQGGGKWFAAVVVERGEGNALVVYQDGASEWLVLESLAPDRLGEDARVVAPRGDETAPGSVLNRVGDLAQVRFDDGATEWFSLAQLAQTVVDRHQAELPVRRNRVMAPWEGDPQHLYVAAIVDQNADHTQLVFLDGARSRCATDDVRLRLPKPGDGVQVRRGEDWAPGTLRLQVDHALFVETEAGSDWTALSCVRVPR